MEPIRLWRAYGYRPFQDEWVFTEPAHTGPEDACEYAALPRADFDALAAEAADARTLRAERDSLVKERNEAVADNIRLDQALRHAVASGKPDAVPSWQYELMRESNRRHRELRDAATARADALAALLKEARATVGPFLRLLAKSYEIVMPSLRGLFALSKRRHRVEAVLARIDAELEKKK